MMIKSRFWLISLFVLALDHLTKYRVQTSMGLHETIEIVPGFFRFTRVHNTGVAFGLFADVDSVWKPYVFAAMAVVAVLVIVIYSRRMPSDRKLLQTGLAITLGGIFGNFTDRILRGWVVDFIEVHYRESFHWPTFNIADSAITIGIALLLLDALRNPDQEVHREEAGPLPQ